MDILRYCMLYDKFKQEKKNLILQELFHDILEK